MIFTDRIIYKPTRGNLLDHTQQNCSLMSEHQCQKKKVKDNGKDSSDRAWQDIVLHEHHSAIATKDATVHNIITKVNLTEGLVYPINTMQLIRLTELHYGYFACTANGQSQSSSFIPKTDRSNKTRKQVYCVE